MSTDLMPYDFGTGNTNPEGFPAAELVAAAARAIPAIATDLNIYPGKLGHAGLRSLLAQRESEREGVAVDPEHIVLTNGSMQAVTLAAEALCTGPHPAVIMEEQCYVGTVNAYKSLGIEMLGVPLDGHGMRIDALEDTLKRCADEGRKPSFIYALTTYQNPTGSMMPTTRRMQLLEVARRYDCIIVEDNCYGDVHYEGDKQPSLFALDDGPNHIYLGSLSKVFAPGVRLGFFYAKPPLLDTLLARRHDAGPNTLAAAIVYEYLKDNLWSHIERANLALKRKRDAMLEGLSSSLGNACSWSHPVGGLFIWVRIPDDIDMNSLEREANARGVAFARGSSFYIHDAEIPYIRLAFGFPSEADIRAGMPQLGEAIAAARNSKATN